jgi:Fe-S cluster biogenesis protein NfuA
MALFGLRTKIKSFIKETLQLEPEETNDGQPRQQTQAPVEPSYEEPPASQPVEAEPSSHIEEPISQEAPAEVSTSVTSSPVVNAMTAEGRDLTPEAVQEVLDDDVRPALQMDGGDIQLVKVENDNIYVKLVGACSTCPSSIMTMRMGVENLLREEFPALKELIEVSDEGVQEAPVEA